MFWFLVNEVMENEVFSSKQMAAFLHSAILTDFSLILSSVFYLIIGIIPSAKVRNGGKYDGK